jgi:hypothetical protein
MLSSRTFPGDIGLELPGRIGRGASQWGIAIGRCIAALRTLGTPDLHDPFEDKKDCIVF